jgi:glycosyltransferase involved in cell wall biosynthesis
MSDLKTALWITSYFPPWVNVCTVRNVKFLKYLHHFGWKAVVASPRATFQCTEIGDHLLKQLSPSILVALMPKDPFLYLEDRQHSNRLARYLSYVMKNIIPPDGHIFWALLALKAIGKEIMRHKPDAVYISSSPFSLNLLGAWIKYKYKIPWVSDFRDLWTLNPISKKIFLRSYDMFVSNRLEKFYLKYCDALIVNTENSREKIVHKYKFLKDKIWVIPNGYDPEDVPVGNDESIIPCTFLYIGSIRKKTGYTPLPIIKLLSKLADHGYLNRTVELHYAGSDGESFVNLIREEKIIIKYKEHGYLVHKDLYRLMRRMEYVLLCMPDASDTSSWIPARLYDYIANNSRLICLLSRGSEVSQTLESYKNGVVVYYDEPENVQISKLMHFISNKRESSEEVLDFISSFSRRELTGRLSCVFEHVAGGFRRDKTCE